MLTEEIKKELIKKSIEMRKVAYCPYSNYCVGAALLTGSGKIYTGHNIENSSFGATNCAERTAVFKAVSEGERVIKAIAISGCKVEEKDIMKEDKSEFNFAYPCGICRQVLREFSNPKELQVFIAASETNYNQMTLEELLPHSYGPDYLLKENGK